MSHPVAFMISRSVLFHHRAGYQTFSTRLHSYRAMHSASLDTPVPFEYCHRVEIIPQREDNYAYLLICRKTQKTAVVDPSDATTVLDIVKRLKLSVHSVLCTHYHDDHTSGVEGLLKAYPKARVYASSIDAPKIPKVTNKLDHGAVFEVGAITLKGYLTPCHTKGHMIYFVDRDEHHGVPSLFVGDTLFISGIGRFFEGTSKDMLANIKFLRTLPMNTLVYCGHEYTVKNLEFARHIEGMENAHILTKHAWAMKKRKLLQPTVPSLLGQETLYNPFLRLSEPTVRKGAGLSSDASELTVLTKLRKLRNKM
eukprot:Rmarinus@m.21011